MFDFSQRMQSSSFRSINCVPVRLRVSTVCSYLVRNSTISFSIELMIEFNLSISMVYCSTCSLNLAPSAVIRVFSFWSWSCCVSKSCASWRVCFSCLSLKALSILRISTSFCRILSFSLSSDKCCDDFWIDVMYLFRSVLTTSYIVQKARCFWLISWCFFFKSSSSNCFIATSSAVSLHWRCASEASRASFSRCEAKVLKCAAQCCSSAFSVFSSFCISSIWEQMASYSSFLSFSKDSCFKYAPMNKSTSFWMSSNSFFCRLASSSWLLVIFSRSLLLASKGPSASATVSFALMDLLWLRFKRSCCLFNWDSSASAKRASTLFWSSSASKATRFDTRSVWVFLSRSSRILSWSYSWSPFRFKLSFMSCKRMCFFARCSLAVCLAAPVRLIFSFTPSISASLSRCASVNARTALSNFSACFRMRSGSPLILICSISCPLWMALFAAISASTFPTRSSYSSNFAW
mmetsp:Transcript_19115/g.57131  ORF Transcript_19115/g.57131 Transcript_19115/m.57131 type:complete len:463 (+) Transcript_19115:930-2318(+)